MDKAQKDHKQIGQELELFFSHEYAPGAPFWLPKGMVIFKELEKYIRSLTENAGYLETSTPIMVKSQLFKESGHWVKFGEHNMYNLSLADDDSGANPESYTLKPMNCPESTIVYRFRPRSYRELPLRLSEIGRLHRKEKSGEVNGLLRVRQITMDDAHIYASEDQIFDEVGNILDMMIEFYTKFGFEFDFRLATRPELFAGTEENWAKAEKDLEEALKKKKLFLFFLIFAATIPFIWKQYAYAQEKAPELTVLAENETVNRDYFAANEAVIIAGTVNGDAYVFGGKVDVTPEANITGDLIVAGGEVRVLGNIRNDLRVAGGEVLIDAKVEGNISVAGGQVKLEKNGQVQNSVNAAGGSITLGSTVGRDVNIAAGEISVDGDIKRDLRYWSERNALISNNASVGGETYPHITPQGTRDELKTGLTAAFTGLSLLFKIASLITTLVIGFLFIKFMPVFTKSTLVQVAKFPLNNFIVGNFY